MTKPPSSFQRNIQRNMTNALRIFIYLSLLRACEATSAYSNIDLGTTTLDPDTTGFSITGNAANDRFGYVVDTAGDIDNDGFDDIIIGAYGKNSNVGSAYVIYGGSKSSMPNIILSTQTLDPATTGFMITGNVASGNFGFSAGSAGDIDNDGYDDIIIGAHGANSYQGVVYVIYGKERSSMANIYLSTALNPATTGFTITGSAIGDYLGYSVSTAGDINNDGYDDIIIGATAIGAAYVIYGGEKSSMANIALSAALNPATKGFMVTGSASGDSFGVYVRSAGDINNDNYDDIIIGAYTKDSNRGAAYVIYGGEKSSMTNIALSSQALNPLTTGFMITGNAVGDMLGASASTAGDINNDGYDDIIIGAKGKNSYQGAAYVIYGREKSSMTNIALSSQVLDPLTTGFMITGNSVGDQFGFYVSTLRNLNKDVYDDIIIGALGKNSDKGAVYVIYGGEKSSMTNIALSSQTLDPLTTGFMITGNAAFDQFGQSVSIAGDINNDGSNDIIVGAFKKNSYQGAAYVIYGAPCLLNCNECSSPSQCSQCTSPYSLYQFDCFDPCPDTTFAETGICKACSTNCNHCSGSSLCTECISPYLLYQSECLDSCPLATFASTNICKDCPTHCVYCKSQNSCIVCAQGYTLSDSLCVLPALSSQGAQEKATRIISSVTKGLGSVICVGSAVFPLSALVSKIVQNTRYLNLSVTSDLSEIYQTWDTNLISWNVPNLMSDLDHFETSPYLFAQYDIDSPFLVNFWPTLINMGIGFGTFMVCIILQKLFENEKYEGWAYNLALKLVAGSFNFALIQAYACLDDILFYLVIDAKTNPFDSFFSWSSLICAVLFLVFGCLLAFFNFWTVWKYQNIKKQGRNDLIEAFNERNKFWELFYSDFNEDDLWSQSFFATLIIRSSLSSFMIPIFYDYPLLQTSYLLMLDGGIILFLYFKNPFNTLQGTLAQYYYEIITLLVHLCAFIISLQDSFDNPSATTRLIMSTGIIYLNTALITGAIGFMFIEIFETIRFKVKARKIKRLQSLPKDNQETQNLTRKVSPFQPSSHLNMESSQGLESHFDVDNSTLWDMNPGQRTQQQRNQMPTMIRHRPQSLNQRQQRDYPTNQNFIMN